MDDACDVEELFSPENVYENHLMKDNDKLWDVFCDESWNWSFLENKFSTNGEFSIESTRYNVNECKNQVENDNNEFKGIDNFISSNQIKFDKDSENNISKVKYIDYSKANRNIQDLLSLTIDQNLQNISKKKKRYRTPEIDLIKKKSIFYKVDYANCLINKGFGNPTRDFIKDLGKDYNIHFNNEIKEKELPKFERVHYRNKGVGIWFFEMLLTNKPQFILPWLTQNHNFKKIVL